MSALVRLGVLVALLVAAVGVGLLAGLGAALLTGGLATAAWLLFVVELPEPAEVDDPELDELGRRRDRTDRRWPA